MKLRRQIPLGVTIATILASAVGVGLVLSRVSDLPEHEQHEDPKVRSPIQRKIQERRREVPLQAGADFQKAVRKHSPGTRFVIAAGVHRLQRVRPKDGMEFVGEPGAVMSGAKVLSSFTQSGATWFATGQTQESTRATCTYPSVAAPACILAGFERDSYNEELFIDGVPMRHVASTGAVTAGKWFFDYAADRIYIGDNPANKLVETSVTGHAFYGTASDVVIDNLTIRHYANRPQTGAIRAELGSDWTIRFVDASYNHGAGVDLGVGAHLYNSKLTYNGQLGFRGVGVGTGNQPPTAMTPIVVEDNEIAHNLRLGYNWGWEGGAMKILFATGTIIRNNWVHHNAGPGIWFDAYNHDTTIVSNLVEHNQAAGIFYEISYGPTEIKWNTVRNNGAGLTGATGAGIWISNSRDTEVFGNAVDSNERGIMLIMVAREAGPDGLLELANVEVRNNDIRMLTGTTGLVDETGNNAYYTSKGNVFEDNVYRLDSPGARRFSWTGRWESPVTWGGWQAIGSDTTGAFSSASGPLSLPHDASDLAQLPYGPRSSI